MIQSLKDSLLEKKIAEAANKFYLSRSPKDWAEFSSLLLQRSPQQVARMERHKGLA